jgi:hypothetical protein
MNMQTALALVEKHAKYAESACAYGEPGYDDPPNGIILANLNDVPKFIYAGLERRGFALEWFDEWTVIWDNDGKAYRTSPTSYSWTPYYVITDDGEQFGGDEIESGDRLEWYVEEYLLNDPTKCNLFKVDFAALGFERFNGDYETGLHHGQNDGPSKVLKLIREAKPGYDVVFDLTGKGQFDCAWQAWIRPAKED